MSQRAPSEGTGVLQGLRELPQPVVAVRRTASVASKKATERIATVYLTPSCMGD